MNDFGGGVVWSNWRHRRQLCDNATTFVCTSAVICYISLSTLIEGLIPIDTTMFYVFFLTHLFFVLLVSTLGLASPLGSQELGERDNKWNLKCSNAPTVIAGS